MNFTIFAVIVGMLLPIQAATNAGAAKHLGDVSYAALLSFVIGTILISSYILIAKPSLNTGVLDLGFPKYIVFGGLISVIYTLAITYLSPKLGVGNTLFVIVTGQLIAAVIVDHFGIYDSVKYEVTPKRILGVLLMLVGLYLTKKQT